jgi:(1->4)-alpha-D-glucan 1-alpha-D-glucosylmutase
LIKLYVTFISLNYRKLHHRLFEEGDYMPLTVDGQLVENVCAFARRGEGGTVLVIVPRFLSHFVRSVTHLPLGQKVWKDSGVVLPEETLESNFINIFTGETIQSARQHGKRILSLGDVFANFPVALLAGQP